MNINSIELYISKHALDPVFTMNRLMEAGIVSDNAVMPCDVAASDCLTACAWLEKQG